MLYFASQAHTRPTLGANSTPMKVAMAVPTIGTTTFAMHQSTKERHGLGAASGATGDWATATPRDSAQVAATSRPSLTARAALFIISRLSFRCRHAPGFRAR